MVKIWAKIIENNKIKADFIYESACEFIPEELYLHMQNICHKLDIPCPVVLKAHVKNYYFFNTCSFLPRDFVENINFDKLTIENANH